MKNWQRIPYVLIMLIGWAIMRYLEVDMSAGSVASTVLVIVSFLVLIAEFYKSADVGLRTFKIELAVTVFTTIVATILITRLVSFEDIHLGDVVLGIVVLCDAWISPVTSFAMALRNIQGNIGSDVNTEGQ
jgi:hypothetical protein